MIFSRATHYAIQALIYMATKPKGTLILSREIAVRLHVPPAYLAKIMQTLSRANLVNSYRGPMGGFSLREDPEKISLIHIVNVVEGPKFNQECVLGLKVCADSTACPMHYLWQPIKARILKLLEGQTLDRLARAVVTGKYRISDLPRLIVRS